MNSGRWICAIGLVTLFITGCAKQQSSFDRAVAQDAYESKAESSSYNNEKFTSSNSTSTPLRVPSLRKIIYTGDIRLVVKNFDGVDQEIADLVEQHSGFISSSTVQSQQHDQRYGQWAVRIPASEFRDFFEAVQDIGIPEVANKDSRDVTEEYVDLEARIKSKKQLETRVLRLLEREDNQIQQVISLEKELERIRSEIERMEGRLRVLKNRVELTSIKIYCREERDYVPPQTPDFDNQISAAWSNSTDNVSNAAQGFAIWFVGAAPWLIVLAVPLTLIIVPSYFVAKKRRRKAQ